MGKFLKVKSSKPGMLTLAVKNYFEIGGTQWAAAFAYYAFFSLFPLLLMAVTVSSLFVDRDRAAGEVVGYFRNYAPLDPAMNQDIFQTLAGLESARNGMLVIIPLTFFWGAFRFFNVLILAVNRAWGTQAKRWWRLPLKNFLMLGITGLMILLGLAVPVGARVARHWLLSTHDFAAWMFDASVVVFPLLALFLGLSLLYRLAPCRPTRFAEVGIAALAAAGMLCVLESLFVVYLRNFAKLNLVYGAFGGMMALLMWIYLSGCVIILGACLSAAQTQVKERWWTKMGKSIGDSLGS